VTTLSLEHLASHSLYASKVCKLTERKIELDLFKTEAEYILFYLPAEARHATF